LQQHAVASDHDLRRLDEHDDHLDRFVIERFECRDELRDGHNL
jgi:hypothetical protein